MKGSIRHMYAVRRGRGALIGTGLCLTMLGGAAIAIANGPGAAITVNDGREGSVLVDLRSVTVQQNQDLRVQAKLESYESFGAYAFSSYRGSPPGSACLRIWIKTRPSSQVPEYLVCATPNSNATKFAGSVLRERKLGGPPRRVAVAQVTHPDGRTLILRFTRASIGSPMSFRFAAEVTQEVGCPGPSGCFDRAPNGVRTRMFNTKIK